MVCRQIVVPHAADQRIQARRVAEAKVGLHLTAHDVRQGQLREGVRALLEAEWVRGEGAGGWRVEDGCDWGVLRGRRS